MACGTCGSTLGPADELCDNCGAPVASRAADGERTDLVHIPARASPAAVQDGEVLARAQQRNVVDAMNRWSSSFMRFTLPSDLGSKALITRCADEGAKVLSIGVYMGHRTAVVAAVPYDGSTYDGHTMKDESTGTLWMYRTKVPDGFDPAQGEKFLVSLGHIFKCSQCRGQGRVRCSSCGGKVRWRDTNWQNEVVEKICSCGDGRMDCPTCTGYGSMLKVLRVNTKYVFTEKKEKEYSGRLPQAYLMGSSGNVIFRHVYDFNRIVIAEAIDGFDEDEFERLIRNVYAELKADISRTVAGQMVDASILHGLVDEYFRTLPNPVAENQRLVEEVLPIRLKCEVTDVPVTAVNYRYKETDFSLYVYGSRGNVWADGDQPSGFTWKVAMLIAIAAVIIGIVATIIATSPHAVRA